ncbi:MAG: hypothetical protein EZS28_023661 [Streblomastix strix]|uniref:Right handed beta helix domain-containing protein n=1 Tax=Streblomastix strix TaxID=222440 RepID=A0A5J4VEC3_9EUKA|nr:MAG: hypothetical protein EZS28_023661 [Streblomastix strix]
MPNSGGYYGVEGIIEADLGNQSILEITQCKFIRGQSYINGGAIHLSIGTSAQITLDQLQFINCSSFYGGGLNLVIAQDVQLTIEQCTFINCLSGYGGGLYCYIYSNGSAELSNVTFDNCSAENGGGIYSSIRSGGKLIIKDKCSFSGCKATSGNGGGIYIEYYSRALFKINDTTFRECEATANTSEIPPTGYGGGIFFICETSIDILPENLNLKGMKIYNNTASNGGQSLYVVMSKLAEWCQYGIDGEHVKGNYTDGLSNKSEIQGFPINSTTFNLYSSTQISEQQVYLEDYWNIERNDYYVKDSGSDTNECTHSRQCQTLDADSITNNINNASSYTVYILDNTTLSSILEITQSSTPRTFRNYSIDSTIISLIQINTGGQFSITGSAHFEYINFTMQSGVSNAYGGVINANLGTALSTLEFLRCNFTDCYSTNMGGALYLVISNSAQATFQLTGFYNCRSNYGGGMYSQVSSGAQITTLTGICQFTYCESTLDGAGWYLKSLGDNYDVNITTIQFVGCKSSGAGGGMYIESSHQGDIQFFQFNFSQCSSSGKGAGLYASLRNGAQLISTGLCIFQLCQSQGNGGGAYFDISGSISKVNLTGINQRITGCIANEGAGIYAVINNYAVVEINNESFTNCSSTESGGGLFASILDAGTINIKSSTFTNCNCTQPGSGGAVSINQDLTSKIFISNSAFSNCKTLVNASNSIYGWGGAIYVYTNITSANLNNTNFLMTYLVFQSCKAVKNNGNNLHIRSPNTKATGSAISSQQLLTVNGTIDLYTSLVYQEEYMGIDESKVNNGNAHIIDHQSLFRGNTHIFIFKDYYVNANSEDESSSCGEQQSPCQRINQVLGFNFSEIIGFNRDEDFISINLQSSTSLEEDIQINSLSPFGYQVQIQSQGYVSVENQYTKQQFLTSLKSNTLFTITDIGHVQLLGLHFDNLDPTSQNPLISISSDDNNQIPKLSIIDCEFNQDQTPDPDPIPYVSHSIISINGGFVTINRTKIQQYKISNGKSLIMIKSDETTTTGVYRKNKIEISNSTFEDIEQSGLGNGAAINAELKDGSLLVIQESTQFIDCLSELYGGAIYSVIQGGSVELSGVTFEGCQGINGGAIYSSINIGGKLILKVSCKFSQCKATSGNGGGLYIDFDFDSEFEFKINDATIRECEAKADPTKSYPTGYGGGIFLTGTGDYDPLTERLNLKGMKIYRNKVDQNGQSLYVVMSKLAEWCNQGTAGEYVKGNYTDRISNKNELQGIPVDSINFITLPIDLIQLAQQPLTLATITLDPLFTIRIAFPPFC